MLGLKYTREDIVGFIKSRCENIEHQIFSANLCKSMTIVFGSCTFLDFSERQHLIFMNNKVIEECNARVVMDQKDITDYKTLLNSWGGDMYF